MRFKNVSPLGDLEIPSLDRIVKHDEEFDVPVDIAPLLAAQTEHFASVDEAAHTATTEALAAWADLAPADEPTALPDAEVPAGTVADVLAWVDGDPSRAAAATSAENLRDEPRSTLLDQLSKIIDPDGSLS